MLKKLFILSTFAFVVFSGNTTTLDSSFACNKCKGKHLFSECGCKKRGNKDKYLVNCGCPHKKDGNKKLLACKGCKKKEDKKTPIQGPKNFV